MFRVEPLRQNARAARKNTRKNTTTLDHGPRRWNPSVNSNAIASANNASIGTTPLASFPPPAKAGFGDLTQISVPLE
jgi:hypothetical protein